jgi:hypothetical protein
MSRRATFDDVEASSPLELLKLNNIAKEEATKYLAETTYTVWYDLQDGHD